MARTPKEPNLETYGGRMAHAIRTNRKKRKLTVAEFHQALSARGVKVAVSTLYHYELGADGGGRDLPLNLIPVLADIFGMKTATGWMPDE